jgi:DNA-binding beta-propeller fold protein YncE
LNDLFQYRANANWPNWPAGWRISEVTAVATDSQDRVFVFSRGDHPVAVFDPGGELLFAWKGIPFTRPHGITIGPDDAVYCVDDLDHTIRKFTPDGRLLMTLGTSGVGSDTGSTSIDYRTIQRAGPPFHYPTNLAIAPSGDLYISDGYGNARIHRFSPEGNLLHSWGEPGAGPGQFHVPHGIAVDPHGVVYVADRENSRLQLFSPSGEFQSEWTDVSRPCEVFIDAPGTVYVAELGYRAGMWPGTQPPHPGATGGRVSVFDSSGKLLARFGGGERPTEPGDFFAPHDIWLDSRGSLYVAEVIRSAAQGQRPASGDYHTLQKFEPV